jgi:hypothetical protein
MSHRKLRVSPLLFRNNSNNHILFPLLSLHENDKRVEVVQLVEAPLLHQPEEILPYNLAALDRGIFPPTINILSTLKL